MAYNILGSSPQSGQHIGILLVEFGVGLTVSNVMIALFNAFASYDEIKRNKMISSTLGIWNYWIVFCLMMIGLFLVIGRKNFLKKSLDLLFFKHLFFYSI